MAQGLINGAGGSGVEVQSGLLYDMTSANTPSPFVVTSINGGEFFSEPWTIFSNSNSGSPVYNNSPALQIDLGEAKYIPLCFKVRYQMQATTLTLTISGSVDGQTWTELGNSSYYTNNSQKYAYISSNLNSNSTPIRYIKFAGTQSGSVQFGGLKCLCNQWIKV